MGSRGPLPKTAAELQRVGSGRAAQRRRQEAAAARRGPVEAVRPPAGLDAEQRADWAHAAAAVAGLGLPPDRGVELLLGIYVECLRRARLIRRVIARDGIRAAGPRWLRLLRQTEERGDRLRVALGLTPGTRRRAGL